METIEFKMNHLAFIYVAEALQQTNENTYL